MNIYIFPGCTMILCCMTLARNLLSHFYHWNSTRQRSLVLIYNSVRLLTPLLRGVSNCFFIHSPKDLTPKHSYEMRTTWILEGFSLVNVNIKTNKTVKKRIFSVMLWWVMVYIINEYRGYAMDMANLYFVLKSNILQIKRFGWFLNLLRPEHRDKYLFLLNIVFTLF